MKRNVAVVFYYRTPTFQPRRERDHFPMTIFCQQTPLRKTKMKNQNGLLIAAAVVSSIFPSTGAFAKTAKDCKAEWQADKAGMQSRGMTEKAYIEQCKGGTEPTAAAPSARPIEVPAPTQATTGGSKTAKDCKAEWQADKAGTKARSVTEKAYVEQCRGGSPPVVAAPQAPPPVPAAPPSQTGTSSSEKTAKECVAEWRADKAGMQARGVTQKVYVEQCRAGGAMPSATAPESKPTVAAPAPAPSRPAPTATEAAPAPAPQKPAPTTTAAPTQPPMQEPATPRSTATLEAGQFADEASAKVRCPADTVVWVNLPSKIYHFAGTRSYGTTKRGAYMCEKDAIAAENRASKTESHP